MSAGALTAQMTVALGCRALDDLLGGGVEEGCITLLHGEAGSGKTNFCLQLARNVVRAGHKVIYIDTEGVSLERLRQICGDDFELVAKNILFSEPYSFEEQEKLIEKAVKLSEGNREVGLIVIDSITMHYRLTMRDETRRDERYGLTRQIGKLLRVSRQRDMPVVVTSQVYTDIDTGSCVPVRSRPRTAGPFLPEVLLPLRQLKGRGRNRGGTFRALRTAGIGQPSREPWTSLSLSRNCFASVSRAGSRRNASRAAFWYSRMRSSMAGKTWVRRRSRTTATSRFVVFVPRP